ncbi:helix-turn-helix domain-containing protein [Streptomyces sp. ME18-1-4]|uniref:helix-turn-helix domain-containing protein n=1 Tax=Streptomyces sp. ME18-1-4 TaxID=3028685 RepID=UPI0029A4378B|nr:helix-turn-helix domain-containing protein [Streptomyces sp. ME18-1-4]MDX3247189.1 helix-turn-helix domain-containing protein [Streptomyces sp. ME18-1-4]
MPTTTELAAIRLRYEYAVEDAEKQRTEDVLAALRDGATQKEIAEATGYTRETVRRIANPEAAEAIRNARRAKKEQPS